MLHKNSRVGSKQTIHFIKWASETHLTHHATSYNSNITPPLSCWHFNLWGWFLPGAAQPLLYRSDPLRVASYQLKEWLKNQFSFICYLFFFIHVSFIGGQEMSLKHFTTWFRNILCFFNISLVTTPKNFIAQ